MTETPTHETGTKTRVIIFHTAHPFSPSGIHSGAEMGTIHLARALVSLGADVKVLGRITSGSGDYDGVWYEDIGQSFDIRLGLSRIRDEVDLLISITRADVLEASLVFPAIKKRMLWMQDSDIALTRADAPRINACTDRVVYVSLVLRELLEKQGIAPEKGVVIHNGYDPTVFYPRQVEVAMNRIMFAGALVPEKGILLLIEAFNILSLRDSDTELWIYGSETLWGYQQLFDQKRITFNNPRIHFAGKVTQQQLGEAYSRASLSVIPSLASKRLDPFPLTSIEAQASGCPVVVSNCGGLPEGVVDGISGVVFKGENANHLATVLEELLSDPAELSQMRRAAVDHVQGCFTWESIARQFLDAAKNSPSGALHAITTPRPGSSQGSKNILVVYEHLPAFDRTGGDFYAYSLFRSILAAGHKITLVARDTFADPGMTEHYRKEYARLGIEVHCLEQIQNVNGDLQRFTIKMVEEVVAGRRFDSVLIFWWHIAQQFSQQLRNLLPAARIVVNSVDIAYMRLLRQAALHDNVEEWYEAATTKRNELDAYAMADVVLAITEDDEAVLKKHLPGKCTAVVPYIHTLDPSTKGYAERRDLVFVAFFEHRPNADAAQFFVSKIFPLVRKQLPGIMLYLVGSAPPAEVKALACKDIIVTGFVPELKPYLQQARVSIVPMRYGAGMKGKIGQSLCEGAPVVTTSIGAEGMNLKDGEHVLIADGAEAFASAVVRLYKDQSLWEAIVRGGRQIVHERWSEERVGARLLDSLLETERSNERKEADRRFPIIDEEEKLSIVATGYDWYQQKFKESALAVFAESVKRYPDFASGYIGLAMCPYAERRFDEVSRLVLLARERSTESSGVITWEALALKGWGKMKPAVAKLRQALSLQPSNALALRTLADLLLKESRPKEAFENYRQLLQKYPADMEALMKTAEIAREAGQHESAVNLMQGALRSAQRTNDITAIRQIGQSLQEFSSGARHRGNGKRSAPAKHAGPKIEKKEDTLSCIAEKLTPTSAERPSGLAARSNRPLLTSIIILTYNNLDFTKKCIQSVQRNTRAPYEIIVVDNCSTDGTRRWLEEMREKEQLHCCILNEENVGFPAGVNQAINRAPGEYILLLNNDTIVTKGWLKRMIDVAESDPAIAIVGPMSNLVSGVQMDTTAKYKDIAGMHEHAAALARVNKGVTLASPRVAFLCTLIKTQLVDTIGGLDERFTPGNFEDDDFCLRAQLAGFKTVVAKDVFIHHFGSKSFGADGREAYAKRIETNRKVFAEKWGADPIEIWKEKKEFRKRNMRYPLSKDEVVQHFERAKILIEEKELALALVSLKKAIECFSSSERRGNGIEYSDLLNATGNVALAVGELETAESCFRRELRHSRDPLRAEAALEKVRRA
ncbi:MAG TPA: hypothetical protein DGH68_09755, partial [Bacteroidetes bacterium]|nr:hypothetical protein [Bacteroidota bacterium]